MADHVTLALGLTDSLRKSRGYHELDSRTRSVLDAGLAAIESALRGQPHDRYALAQDISDLQERLQKSAGSRPPDQPPAPPQQAAPPPPPPPPAPVTSQIGARAAAALEAVNFPGFVASLVTGTFQAVVDASAQQIREYAKLVESLSSTVEDFSRENVSLNQARERMAAMYPEDLQVDYPPTGAAGSPRLVPRRDRVGESPEWLAKYNLGGQELTEDLTEGPLLEAGRNKVGEERIQTLATLVLMGINRVVVNDGDIRAKLQFHAVGKDSTTADIGAQIANIAQRPVTGPDTNNTQLMVSTLKANAQAEASIKADLMGEVRISFRSETFPLERFADSAALQLLSKHARWRTEEPAPAPTTPPATTPPAAPPTTPPTSPGGTH